MVFGSFQPAISSRFLAELPEDPVNKSSNFDFYNDFSSDSADDEQSDNLLNKRIFHQKFGYGKVVKICDDKLDIVFEKTGPKTIVKKFVSLS